MGQFFFSLHNCNVMHYNSKLVCNGNYISITFELHFHMVTFLHTFLQIKNALSLHLSIFLLILSSSLLFALIMPHLLSQNVLVHIFTSQLVFLSFECVMVHASRISLAASKGSIFFIYVQLTEHKLFLITFNHCAWCRKYNKLLVFILNSQSSNVMLVTDTNCKVGKVSHIV